MLMSGYLGGRIEFPQWLGKNSSRNKHDRILQELKTHLALRYVKPAVVVTEIYFFLNHDLIKYFLRHYAMTCVVFTIQ